MIVRGILRINWKNEIHLLFPQQLIQKQHNFNIRLLLSFPPESTKYI